MTLEEFMNNEVVDYDMDSYYIYLKLDKDKYDLPFLVKKDDLGVWVKHHFIQKAREEG